MGYAPCLQETSLQDWIVVEVSRAVHEELPDIIDLVDDTVTARFQGQSAIVQKVYGVVKVTWEQEIGLDVQLGKKEADANIRTIKGRWRF